MVITWPGGQPGMVVITIISTTILAQPLFGPISLQLKRLAANGPLAMPQKISGSRKTGFLYEARYRVKAIGYFNLIWPKGYKVITARAAVVAYPFGTKTGHPMVDQNLRYHPRSLDEVLRALAQKLNLDPVQESF